MGKRKKLAAEQRKEQDAVLSTLQGLSISASSPRKMRLVADMVRGMEVNKALGVLRFSSKQAATPMEKLLRSAISNWEQKNGRQADRRRAIYLQDLCR